VFNNILVGTDGSGDAVRAAEAAAKIADCFNSRVTLLSVYAPPIIATPEMNLYELEQDALRDLQDNVIARTAEPFLARNLSYDSRTAIGNPAAEIVSIAEQLKSDLIVIGSHGVGGLRRFLLGSVSDRVGHYAHCTVMIVKQGNQ